MKNRIHFFASAVMALSVLFWASGCPRQTAPNEKPKAGSEAGQHGNETKHEAGHEQEEEHEQKALTESDIKMPNSFKTGVARLEELNETVEHHIEHNTLAEVHHVAEEMALIAKKMKQYAQTELKEDQLVDAGMLCNEVAGYYPPIDEAADAGKKAETEAIHKQLAAAIAKLKALIGPQ